VIAELVRQYDTLKRCNEKVPDPYFAEMKVWIDIILKSDGSFHLNWLGKPKDTQSNKKNTKEEPCIDLDCPVTEKSSSRAVGNESPHGIVDNAKWIFGKFATEKQIQKKVKLERTVHKGTKKAKEVKQPPDEARRCAYLNQLKDFYNHNPETLNDVKLVYDCLCNDAKRAKLWIAVEKLLQDKIIDGKGAKLFEKDQQKWQRTASTAKIRWVVQRLGESGKPINSFNHVKMEWKAFQETKNEWWITSLLDGQQKPARILHPKIKGASLVSFNNVATYCGHLSPLYRGKPGKRKETADGSNEKKPKKSRDEENTDNKKEETDGSALPAQIGFEEAEKYAKALDWLIENSSVKFGDSVSCIWIDQGQSDDQQLDMCAHALVKSQDEKSVFTRGKAKGEKGKVLADTGDLLKAIQRFRNGQKAEYRDKRFYLLSILLRQHGRHALLGSYVGTMGLLDDNASKFVTKTKILIPPKYITGNDEAREFCPSLMDILSAAGIKSEKKPRLVWNREIIEVIVAGRPLPVDICRLVMQKAIKDKHLERSEKKRTEYLALLAIAAGCARHYLTANQEKEGYGMGLDINMTDAGYLAGRLFALCENIQKRGRNWGPTFSDKLFTAAIGRPRQTLVQLYKNCLCYAKDISKANDECFEEIFNKVKLYDSDNSQGEVLPEKGVDQFSFVLGYWHQRSDLKSKEKKDSIHGNDTEAQTNH
jgi:hypothetical protein